MAAGRQLHPAADLPGVPPPEAVSAPRDTDDLVSVGAYVPGANPKVDEARARVDAIEAFLCQPSDTLCGFADATTALQEL